MKYVGRHKSKALSGVQRITCADWGETLVGLSNNTWMTVFLSLDDNHPVVETIIRLGDGPISMSTDGVSETTPAMLTMLSSVESLETFECKVYTPKISTRILSELRWELFRANNIESEMLNSTYRWHIDSTCTAGQLYMVMRDSGYTSPHPSLLNLEGDGWSEKGCQPSVSYS